LTGEEVESRTSEEEIPFVPIEPNPFWKSNAEKLVGESISKVEDNAKQIVIITGLLQSIYFNAIKLSDIKKESIYSIFIYVTPLLLWILSLIFIMLLMFRNHSININSTRDSKNKFEEIVKIKYRYIQISGVFLVLSFVALSIAILHYLSVF